MKHVEARLKKSNTVQYRVEADGDEAVADELVRQVWAALGHPGRRCSVSVARTGAEWVVTVARPMPNMLDMDPVRGELAACFAGLDRRGRRRETP